MNEHNPYYGVIDGNPSESDYLGADITFPTARKSETVEYNQKEVSPVSCTIHGSMGAYSDLTGYQFSLEERKALWDKALELGANPNMGWYTGRAVDLIRRDRGDVASFTVYLNTPEFREVLEKGYSVVASYRGNKEFGADFKADGILDLTDLETTTYGHCIRIKQSEKDVYDLVVDNYLGREYNIYKVPEENFSQLVLNGIFYPAGYIYVMKEDLEIPEWALKGHDFVTKNGISDGLRPNENITRAEMWTMLERFYNLNK